MMSTKKYCSVFIVLLLAMCQAARAQVYTGHDGTPRLRGYNLNSATLSSSFPALVASGANSVRYELQYNSLYPGYSATYDDEMTNGDGQNDNEKGYGSTDIPSPALASYHAWMVWEVTNSSSDLNTCLTFCAANNIKVLIDQHYPAGGGIVGGPDRIFLYNDDEQEFLSDWTLIAQTYAGNSAVWGYDVCNEPYDGPQSGISTITTWNSLVLAAAQNIRSVDSAGGSDPQHAIIVEPGDSEGFPGLTALSSVAGVVYSMHDYGDTNYSEETDIVPNGSFVWPDPSPTTPEGVNWNFNRFDITQIYSHSSEIADVRAFQAANNCQIFVGEYDCNRWAPGSAEFINEFINYFESFGWDWSFLDFQAQGYNGWDSQIGPSTGPDDPVVTQTNYPFQPKTNENTALTGWMANDIPTAANYNFLAPAEGTGSSAFKYNPSGSLWTFSSTSGVAGNGSAFNNPNSLVGTQCAFLQTNSSQPGLISTTVQWVPGESYVVSFNGANRSGYAAQTVDVYVGGSVSSGTLSGGTLVGQITPSSSSFLPYSTPAFTAGQASQLLSFVGASSSSDQTAFLDNVTIAKSPVTDFNFSSPALGSQVIDREPSGTVWSYGGSAGLAANSSQFNNPSTAVGQAAYIQSTTSSGTSFISEPVVWMPNTPYIVQISSAGRLYSGYLPQTLNVYVGGSVSGGSFSGGTLVGTITPYENTWDNYATAAFTVGTGSLPVTQPLTFVGSTSTGDQTAFISNIAVVTPSPSTLPLGSQWLAGTTISDGGGASGSNAYNATAVTDGNLSTYYNSVNASGGWTGIDLGAGNTATVTHIYFYPRSDNGAPSMSGGYFQGSSSPSFPTGSQTTTLFTINNNDGNYGQVAGATPGVWCQVPVTNAPAYRYFRYVGPSGSHCNVAEVRYYGNETGYITDSSESGNTAPAQEAFDGNTTTSFESKLASGGWCGIDLGAGNQGAAYEISYYPDGTPSKMVGGEFDGSNDKSNWTKLTSISSTPPSGTWSTIITPAETNAQTPKVYPTPYRYFRYYNSGSGNSGVGEIQFYGDLAHQLSGTNINDAWGTTWGNPPTNAYDGSTTTCYESNLGNGGWTGLDFGTANPRVITSIRFYPDSSWSGGPSQMIGGVFQGSNDENTWTNLTTQLSTAPAISTWTTLSVLSNVPYRYVRYYDNGSGSNYCDVAEVQYIGY